MQPDQAGRFLREYGLEHHSKDQEARSYLQGTRVHALVWYRVAVEGV